MNIVFSGSKMEFNLAAQTPMIHFQHGEDGATLRASEVKPKLDRFIMKKMRHDNPGVSDFHRNDSYGSIFRENGKESLDYSMSIRSRSYPKRVDLKQYKSFYGNQNQEKKDFKYGIWSDPVVTIICFNEMLRGLIQKYIVEFFLVTNFGTMQSKGFGSFILAPSSTGVAWSPDTDIEQTARFIKEECDATRCFCMRFSQDKNKDRNDVAVRILNEICQFYKIMKSGYNISADRKSKKAGYVRSYIYQYMHGRGDNNINNEKAWMKQNHIAPNEGTEEHKKVADLSDYDARFLRALLGTGDSITYLGKRSIEIKNTDKYNADDKSPKFERVPSPVFFKVIENCVFIAARPVPKELYGASFQFTRKWETDAVPENDLSKTIKVPTKAELQEKRKGSIEDFLASYISYYLDQITGWNGRKLGECVNNLRRNKNIREVTT